MTVKELIEVLETFNDDARVNIIEEETGWRREVTYAEEEYPIVILGYN